MVKMHRPYAVGTDIYTFCIFLARRNTCVEALSSILYIVDMISQYILHFLNLYF